MNPTQNIATESKPECPTEVLAFKSIESLHRIGDIIREWVTLKIKNEDQKVRIKDLEKAVTQRDAHIAEIDKRNFSIAKLTDEILTLHAAAEMVSTVQNQVRLTLRQKDAQIADLQHELKAAHKQIDSMGRALQAKPDLSTPYWYLSFYRDGQCVKHITVYEAPTDLFLKQMSEVYKSNHITYTYVNH